MVLFFFSMCFCFFIEKVLFLVNCWNVDWLDNDINFGFFFLDFGSDVLGGKVWGDWGIGEWGLERRLFFGLGGGLVWVLNVVFCWLCVVGEESFDCCEFDYNLFVFIEFECCRRVGVVWFELENLFWIIEFVFCSVESLFLWIGEICFFLFLVLLCELGFLNVLFIRGIGCIFYIYIKKYIYFCI